MSTARSVFTEAIEEHLALKKQNVALEASMPLARYDVGDPLDRYPGGPGRAVEGTMVIAEDVDAADEPGAAAPDADAVAAQATQVLVGPSPEQAMEAATALETPFADRPFEPLTGMAPMLSLVEDIDEEDEDAHASAGAAVEQQPSGDVLRFPGGVGPREEQSAPSGELEGQLSVETQAFSIPAEELESEPQASATATAVLHDAPTGEQPVLVIDADEPLAGDGFGETFAAAPAPAPRESRRKPRFFGIGRKKSQDEGAAEGWFTDGPRDFNWD